MADSVIIAIRMDADERALVKAAANMDGMKMSTWFKYLARARMRQQDRPETQPAMPSEEATSVDLQSALQQLEDLLETPQARPAG